MQIILILKLNRVHSIHSAKHTSFPSFIMYSCIWLIYFKEQASYRGKCLTNIKQKLNKEFLVVFSHTVIYPGKKISLTHTHIHADMHAPYDFRLFIGTKTFLVKFPRNIQNGISIHASSLLEFKFFGATK